MCAPRITALFWLAFTLPAVWVVLPFWLGADAVLAHHPLAAASGAEAAALDDDLARAAPLRLGGAVVLAVLAGAFLAGGVLGAFRRGEPFHLGQFLGDCGYRWFANLRVVALGALGALLLGGVLDLVEHRLVPASTTGEPGPLGIRPEHWRRGWEVGGALGFVALVGLAKLAMARVARSGRHAALAAWAGAVATLLRRPGPCLLAAPLLVAIWVGSGAGAGALSRWLDATCQRPWLAFAAAQLGVLGGVWTSIAALLVARAIDAGRSEPVLDEPEAGDRTR